MAPTFQRSWALRWPTRLHRATGTFHSPTQLPAAFLEWTWGSCLMGVYRYGQQRLSTPFVTLNSQRSMLAEHARSSFKGCENAWLCLQNVLHQGLREHMTLPVQNSAKCLASSPSLWLAPGWPTNAMHDSSSGTLPYVVGGLLIKASYSSSTVAH